MKSTNMSLQSSPHKESYLFVFPNLFQADFWLMKAHLRFHSQIVFRDRKRMVLEFEDSTFYFKSESQFNQIYVMQFDYVYSGDAIYIILDDVERLRLLEGTNEETLLEGGSDDSSE